VSRSPKGSFYADSSYSADVTAEQRRLRLVVTNRAGGWLCMVVYPDSNESIMLADFDESDAAIRHLEDWARQVHRISTRFEWLEGA
jgi:hypothetical protein